MNTLLAFGLAMMVGMNGAIAVESRLIGGKKANPSDWPASVYASMSGSRCSATVVGERVLFIASHCVSNGGVATFKVAGKQFSSRCTRNPGYAKNATADWALCLTDTSVTDVPFESLNYDPTRVRIEDKLMLSGYGCVTPGGGGGNDGVLRIGEATVKRLPSGTNHDIVTRGGAALCFGDSGGAAYYVDSKTGSRWVVGINSRGDISTTSYLSSVSVDASKDFIKRWSQDKNQVICGVHTEALGCRL